MDGDVVYNFTCSFDCSEVAHTLDDLAHKPVIRGFSVWVCLSIQCINAVVICLCIIIAHRLDFFFCLYLQ